MNIKSLALSSALVSLVALAGSANAATVGDKVKQNGAGACQGALPAFAGTLRARPLALQNEGSSNAFASCALQANDESNLPNLAGIHLRNNTAASVSVTCTLVNGAINVSNEQLTKSTSVPANGGINILWSPSELSGGAQTNFGLVNWSCNLPSGTGIGYVYYYFDREIGA